MLLFALGKGVLLGLAIAIPVGPIGVLCIRRTLSAGHRVGLLSGLGAATADGLYGMVAAFGLSTLADLLVEHSDRFKLGGGLFLCYLGLTTLLTQSTTPNFTPADSSSTETRLPSKTNLLGIYISTLALTLTNPATILSFIAIFAGLGITESNLLTAITLVFGVFTGSMLWWLVLVSGVTYLRDRLTPARLSRFNYWASKLCGLLILGFGITALAI